MPPKKNSVQSKASKAPQGVLRSGNFSGPPVPAEKRPGRTKPRSETASSDTSSSAEGPWRPVTGPKNKAPRGPPPVCYSRPCTATTTSVPPPAGGPVPKHLPAGPPPPTPAPMRSLLRRQNWCCSSRESGEFKSLPAIPFPYARCRHLHLPRPQWQRRWCLLLLQSLPWTPSRRQLATRSLQYGDSADSDNSIGLGLQFRRCPRTFHSLSLTDRTWIALLRVPPVEKSMVDASRMCVLISCRFISLLGP